MIVTEQNNSSAIDNSNGKQFTIAHNSRSFKILSDGIYSDKITAIIRELSCNAYDSHVAANKSELKFDVHLPNSSEPYFSITDYGTGLSDSDIYTVYTSYFSSTKTNSNQFVGQLGLGSKSPFCYTNEFFVYSRYNGKSREYRLYYDATDTPTVAFINETDSDETGVTVKFTVNYRDHDEFKYKAKSVFRWFKTKPNIIGNTQIDLSDPRIDFQGDGWAFLHPSENANLQTHLVLARMGNVAYPLDRRAMNLTDGLLLNFWESPVVIDFNIGDLEVSASRESLGYDSRTVNNITDRMHQIIADFNTRVQKLISEQKDIYLAKNTFSKLFCRTFYKISRKKFINVELKHNDVIVVDEYITVSRLNLLLLKMVSYESDSKRGEVITSPDHMLPCDGKRIIILDDVMKNTSATVKYFIKNNNYERYYVLTKSPSVSFEDVKLTFGNHPTIMMSKLDRPPVVVKPYKPKANIYRLNWFNPGILDRSTLDIPNLTGYYVELVNKEVKLSNGRSLSMYGFHDIISKINNNNNLINRSMALYGSLNDASLTELKSNKNMFNLVKIIENKILTVLSDSSFTNQYCNIIAWRKELQNARIFPDYMGELSKYTFELDDENSLFKKLAKFDREMTATYNTSKFQEYSRYIEISPYFDCTPKLEESNTNQYKLFFNEVKKRYELLRLIPATYWTSNLTGINKYINLVDMTYYQAILADDDPFESNEPTW